MNVIAVDDERSGLNVLTSALESALPDAEVFSCASADECLRYASHHHVDVAFLDVRLQTMSGIELAMALKQLQCKINIVFATAYADYALDALNLYVSGYLLKPITPEKITSAMEHLRHPLSLTATSKMYVQCFGNFEAFMDGKPIDFRYSKTKELLAYLVDRKGASVNTSQLCAALWEGKDDSSSLRSQLRNSISDLVKSLTSVQAEKCFLKSYNRFAIVPKEMQCDYYEYLKGNPLAINAFRGEYMTQYSWGEVTLSNFRFDPCCPKAQRTYNI